MIYVVVAYDVPDDRHRRKLAKLLLGFGARVQRSVYECELTEQEYERLLRRLERVRREEDSIRVYRLPPSVARQTVIFGGPGLVSIPDLTIL